MIGVMNKKWDVFISYSRSDTEAAEKIANHLRNAGLKIWFERWALIPGTSWQEEIEKALTNSSVVLFLIGSTGFGKFQKTEFHSAIKNRLNTGKFHAIPVLLPASRLESIPEDLRSYSCVDLRKIPDEEGMLDKLLSSLEALGREELAQNNPEDKNIIAYNLYKQGEVAQKQRDFDAAQSLYRKSLEINQELNDSSNVAILLYRIATVAQEQRDYAKAESWYHKSLAIHEKQGNKHGIASIYHQLGMIAQEQHDYAKAESWYYKSLAILEKQGNEHGAASIYHQLGMIAQEQRDYVKAESWYQKSLAIEETQGNEFGAASSYHQLGMIAQEQRDYTSAEAWYQKSLEISEKFDNRLAVARSCHQIGRVAEEQREFQKAEMLFRKALELSEMLGDRFGAVSALSQLGIVHTEMDKLKSAISYHIRALVERLNLKSNLLVIDLNGLAKLTSKVGAKKFEEIVKDLLGNDAGQNLLDLLFEWESDKKKSI